MSADLGELGRQAEARRRQRATPEGSTIVKSPRLGVPASKVGNHLRNVELAPEGDPIEANQGLAEMVGEGSTRESNAQPPDRVVQPLASPVEEPLEKATIWLSGAEQAFLDQVSHAAHARKPRLSLSRSAVTRLALTRLQEQMSPTDIAELLSRTPEHKPAGAGRKRR